MSELRGAAAPDRDCALVVFLLFCLVASGVRFLATFIKTYDGRRVVIPNAGLFSDSVIVNTAHETPGGGPTPAVAPVLGRSATADFVPACSL